MSDYYDRDDRRRGSHRRDRDDRDYRSSRHRSRSRSRSRSPSNKYSSSSGIPSAGMIPSAAARPPLSNTGGLPLGAGYSTTLSAQDKINRELFVGNTPPGTSEALLMQFLSGAMRKTNLCPPDSTPILACRTNQKFT